MTLQLTSCINFALCLTPKRASPYSAPRLLPSPLIVDGNGRQLGSDRAIMSRLSCVSVEVSLVIGLFPGVDHEVNDLRDGDRVVAIVLELLRQNFAQKAHECTGCAQRSLPKWFLEQ